LTLRREIQQLNFCFTHAEIKHAPANNHHSVLFLDNQAKQPVGLRIFDAKEVYVQNERYLAFSAFDQAMFVIHEAMHTFIPIDVDMRDNKIHNIVHEIAVIQGDPASEGKTFARTIENSDVFIPSTTESLHDQKFLTYLFANEQDRAQQLIGNKITVAELLRARTFDYGGSLPDQDESLINHARYNLKDAVFLDFCIDDDETVLAKLRTENSSDFDIDLYCVSAPGALDRLLDHAENLDFNSVNQFLKSFYSGVESISFTVKKQRIYASKEIDWISGNPTHQPKARVALAIAPAFKIYGAENADERLVQYERLLVALSTVLSTDDWLNVVKQNQQFVAAFNLNRVNAALDVIQNSTTNPAPVADEPRLVKENLRSVYQAALQGIVDALNFHERGDYADKLSEYINQTNFEFQVDDDDNE
jgi:hypothetical protein